MLCLICLAVSNSYQSTWYAVQSETRELGYSTYPCHGNNIDNNIIATNLSWIFSMCQTYYMHNFISSSQDPYDVGVHISIL